ncbi:ribbon-helix-helix protein, CopG family [Myxosarcina sp. GI1(2024)]
MNFNLYLEDELERELQNLARVTGKSRNALIREAIQSLISQHHKSKWSKNILDFRGIKEGLDFESYRDELLNPEETEVI